LKTFDFRHSATAHFCRSCLEAHPQHSQNGLVHMYIKRDIGLNSEAVIDEFGCKNPYLKLV